MAEALGLVLSVPTRPRAVEDFLAWTRANGVYEYRIQRKQSIIFKYYTRILCILMEIGEERNLELFMSRIVNDKSLPLDPDDLLRKIPTFNPKLIRAFCDCQWRYCVPEFNSLLANTTFDKDRILPIVSKEKIGEGATATTYQVKIHPFYDRFQPPLPGIDFHAADTYALKTFIGRDSEYYLAEINTYQKLAQCHSSGLIRLYGNYVQGNTFNAILELADKGSLEQYFSYCQPPTSGPDILNFWGHFLRIIPALISIHYDGGSGKWRGFHQNIKPETILIKGRGRGSPYQWQFKLGGLGFCQFCNVEDGTVATIDGSITRTYGAPECTSRQGLRWRKITQTIDIWSLGCVFSEVAVWIVSGYTGVKEYRNLRREEIHGSSSLSGGHYFHDGHSVLPAVGATHVNLLANLRQSDTITAAVLHLVTYNMLVPAADRMNADQLWRKVQDIDFQAEVAPEVYLPSTAPSSRQSPSDPVFLIDSSSSMAQYWKELIVLVGLLAYLTKSDKPIYMLCTTNAVSVESTRSSAFVKSLNHIQPGGISDVGSMLETVLHLYFDAEDSSSRILNPLTVYIFTDGLWSRECDVVSPIRNVAPSITYRAREKSFCTVQFIRFGMNFVSDVVFGGLDSKLHNGKSEEEALSDFDSLPSILDGRKIFDSENSDERAAGVPPDPPERGTDVQSRINSPEHPHVGTDVESSLTKDTSLGHDIGALGSDFISRAEPQPFQDSGYEGSTERQLSLIGKSVIGRLSAIDHSAVLSGTDSGKTGLDHPVAGHDGPSELSVRRTSDYDVRSIVSDDVDIQSKRSSKATYQERLAEQNLGYLLARNPQFRPLSEEALHRVGKIRFVDNLRRLLKRYYIDLRPIATTKLEIATVNLLRSRYSRARLAQQISDILAPENEETNEEIVQHAETKRQELESWIAHNPEFVPPGEVVEDLDLEIDESSSDEEVIEETRVPTGKVQVEIEEPNLPNIDQMENFLLTGGDGSPFQTLSTHLRLFLLPPTLGPLVRILMSLPQERVWLDVDEDNSLLNKFKSFVEDMTEENWNWWPLRPRMRNLEKDQMRLHWLCHCNTHLWVELPRFSAEKLQALVRGKPLNTQSPHLCARSPRKFPSLYARFVQAAGSTSSAPSQRSNQPASSTNTSLPGIQLQPLVPSGQAVYPPAAGPQVTGGQGVQVNINRGMVSELFVLFGVKGSRRTLELAQIDVSKHKDSIFFHDLLHEYRQRRGFWRYWFSVWQLRHCDFVKFEKIRANRAISNKKHDLPVDILYEYTPRPPNADIPPIDPHEFELSLSPCSSFCVFKLFHDCIEPPDGGLALERIPKRKRALELKIRNREQAWGLLAQHSISALLIFSYQAMIVAGPLAIWGWWQALHPDDIQNASTPLTVVVALLCLFWGSAGVLKVLRDTNL
ncbi:hypothetical protein IFR05_005239 [Cadophora sp. M221]|nr:hypothetical protein IFR05_005239 [Cadophora sp. M221]